MRSEFEDEYDAWCEGEEHEVKGAILSGTIRDLAPDEPVKVTRSTTVREAARLMKEMHHGAVVVIDDDDSLAGIFTERDVVTRVVCAEKDEAATTVGEVMTGNPEALTAHRTVAYAMNRMSVGGYRHIPLVDENGKVIGMLAVRHFLKFLVSLFPEATINLPPEGEHINLTEIDGG